MKVEQFAVFKRNSINRVILLAPLGPAIMRILLSAECPEHVVPPTGWTPVIAALPLTIAPLTP